MKPRALVPGDTVALVSPASPLGADKLEFVTGLLEGEGYRVVVGEHALEASDYLAGTDADRAADLHWAFDSDEVDAVLCTRGGYGCARLFPYLDLDRIAARSKLFLGFSDITTLHLALNRRGLPTVHAPMALTLAYPREPWTHDSFLRSLKGDLAAPPEAPVGECIVPGVARGQAVGGCLCLVADSLGTPDAFDGAGKIVILEDVDEKPHRIDAMLTHLVRSGSLDGVAGLVVGEMTRTDQPENTDPTIGARGWRAIVQDRLAPLGVPMVVGYPFGHQANQLSLGLGIEAELDARAGTLVYTEPLCA